jgi:hypothetical protein
MFDMHANVIVALYVGARASTWAPLQQYHSYDLLLACVFFRTPLKLTLLYCTAVAQPSAQRGKILDQATLDRFNK